MIDSRSVLETKSNNRICSPFHKFITSSTVEGFFFAMVCSTVLCGSMFNLWWDIAYKYRGDNIVPIHWFSDYNFFAIIMLIVTLYYSVRKLYYGRKIRFDMALALFCQAMILTAVMDYHRQDYSVVKWAWILPSAYIIGKAVISDEYRHANERIEIIFFSLVVGMFISSALDFYNNFRLVHELGYLNTESWQSFWFSGNTDSRPTFEFGYVLMSATCGYLLYRTVNKPVFFVLTIMANCYIQYTVMRTEGRENRILLPLNIIFFIMLFLFDNYNTFSKKRRLIIKIVAMTAVLAVLLSIIAFKMNWGGVYDKYLNSGWSTGGGVIKNVRLQINKEAFYNLLKYPTEDWAQYEIIMDRYSLAHSLFLEYGRVYSLVLFGLLVVFRVLILKDLIRMALIRKSDGWCKYFVIPGMLSLILYDLMEPNTYYHKRFWLASLIISGMIRAKLEINSRGYSDCHLQR